MSVQKFIAAVKANSGKRTSLRSVFPGRGKVPTETRQSVKRWFEAAGNKAAGVVFDYKSGLFFSS